MTKNNIDISKYNIKLSDDNKNKLFGLIIICLIALLFKDKFSIYIEKVLLFCNNYNFFSHSDKMIDNSYMNYFSSGSNQAP